ncbi:NTF2-like protein [Glarea lozoyensis ATCC 20868]|uniref:Nuclear transport factor 2 n=2 Tax=Glarea lozoyensis TaxID=101852 RepID=S3CTK0_GLAL2|nr:NTF2-like protein [Glarea lozoyensis ATCC 20868]EHL03223.1 putative Nuclear transport factor 2 [Glarea lozoyensis 74030]EPE28990.1 NTF2-like protein [Glarea lozoyensis ATCC 20868]
MATHDYAELARQFTQAYYEFLNGDVYKLAGVYRDNSMLTFESDSFLGASSIVEHYNKQKVEGKVVVPATQDAQPSNDQGGVIVLVTGLIEIHTPDEVQSFKFSQVFQLLQDAQGFFVFNDVFKLVYG